MPPCTGRPRERPRARPARRRRRPGTGRRRARRRAPTRSSATRRAAARRAGDASRPSRSWNGAMTGDGGPELADPRAVGRDRLDDRRRPVAVARQLQHLREVTHRLARAGTVRLVDDEHVGDLEQARLRGLYAVAPAGVHDDDRRVGRLRDLDLDLPDTDGLDDHQRLTGGIEHAHGLRRREREAAEMPAGRHGADEHAGIGRVVLHAHPVAEDRPAAERARRVDREHAHLTSLGRRRTRRADRSAWTCPRPARR